MNIPLDFDRKAFWQENARCFKPFSTDKPRAALTLMMEDHFITHLIPMESTVRYYTDPAYTLDMNKKANDYLEQEIGTRMYSEDCTYYIKGAFEVLMGARRIIREGNTPWLETQVEDIEGVKKIIAYAEKWDAKKQAIPDEWREAKEKLRKERGKSLFFAHMLNGPATVTCNLLGTTNTCFFIMEEPEVMDAYFEIMAQRYIEFYEAASLEDHGKVTRDELCINDDDCYIFPPGQYERFCVPFIKKLIDVFAPLPEHRRRQHSDSAMGHLLDYLRMLGINEVNLGPELNALDIRKKLPKAMIHGQVPPYVLRNGTAEELFALVKRDFENIGGDGGFVEGLCGVVPESTPMEQIRAYMYAVHTLTRYC
jgi:uroporphyrinogen decarboxylase